jgi:hypothetical protein
MEKSRFTASIDSISEGKAVIIVTGGGKIVIPAEKLPSNSSEGSILSFTIELDNREMNKRLKKAEKIRKSLKGGNNRI